MPYEMDTRVNGFERDSWSRACGSGIGLSGHKTHYNMDVTIGNYVEDRSGKNPLPRTIPTGGSLSQSTTYKSFTGTDVPLAPLSVNFKSPQSKDFWRLRESVASLRYSTTSDSDYGHFYKRGLDCGATTTTTAGDPHSCQCLL